MEEITPELKAARQKFIDEKLQYYIDDPSRRAVDDDGNCFYRSPEGKQCIIGSCIPETVYERSMENKTLENNEVQEKLPVEILNLGIDFLAEVQLFHDNNYYWTDSGLSESGINQLETIKRHYL